jgi:hypothetical protein
MNIEGYMLLFHGLNTLPEQMVLEVCTIMTSFWMTIFISECCCKIIMPTYALVFIIWATWRHKSCRQNREESRPTGTPNSKESVPEDRHSGAQL